MALGCAASLGCEARLASSLVDDFIGKFVCERLSIAGISTDHIFLHKGQISQIEFSAIHSKGISSYLSPREETTALDKEIDIPAFLEGASALLIDGTYPELQKRAAALARGRGIPVICDPGSNGNQVMSLAQSSDILIVGDRVAADIAPSDDPVRVVRELAKLGSSAVILTLDDSACVGFHNGNIISQAAPTFPCVDATGASAVFLGALTASLLSHLPFADCLAFASAAAAISGSRIGGWAAIPDRDEVLACVSSNATILAQAK